ncbi:ABC transporter ATP-binding protein [Actinomyces qiguomingii]|uniref:ABC transporter ATP-binding protein n=1 Tax=Actinomyces qiguomingii TaxID=2057800 RepID=UPI001E5E5AB4|nr:ATP-binding cassette domain-containing protein [Actinomyces qiguomingii]
MHEVTFEAQPGKVTAFLGPNGAGKSSTLRILLGLDHATSGRARFDGLDYPELKRPLTHVGALLDGLAGAKSRKVGTQLSIVAESNGITRSRVGEVLDAVGMTAKRSARLGTLSLGESQRVGLAQALLGDPQFLILDEPTNGLDPAGIRWFRGFASAQARSGKTVLLSSHLLSEVQEIADTIAVIAGGRIVMTGSMPEVLRHMESLEDLFFELTEDTQ